MDGSEGEQMKSNADQTKARRRLYEALDTRSKRERKAPDGPFTNRHFLAKRWLCSTMTLKRMEKASTLPFLKMGKQVLYRMSDVERIEQQAEAGC